MKEIDPTKCPVCGMLAKITFDDHGEEIVTRCPRCLKFVITQLIFTVTPLQDYKNWNSRLSYWIRHHQQGDRGPKIDTRNIESILQNINLPSVKEQSNIFVSWIADKTNSPGEDVIQNMNVIASIIGAKDRNGVYYIATDLDKKGIIKAYLDSGDDFQGHLTPDGWEFVESLNEEPNKNRIAFMAMQYNDHLLDSIYKKYFKPTLNSMGIDLVTLDERLKAGIMDNQLREEIRNSHLLLVDLTHGNSGAYWEAGFAEGCKIPVVYLCERTIFRENKTHFDTNHLTTVIWSVDTIKADMEILKNRIIATLGLTL
ncbi:MAG: hypothetical protein KGZ85_15455 [Ignavibacterium sp.]|nr:hypothetical protein [Ignavibacterium sp.]